MATANAIGHETELQPVSEARLYTVDQFLHDVQALPILSRALLNDAREGESYELLQRRITDLHLNISEYAERAKILETLDVDFVLQDRLLPREANHGE